jgi:myxalamid-type polyketide synthase MxaE and MxaD
VASVDWSLLKPVYEARRRRPLLEYMGAVSVQETRAANAAANEPALLVQLESAPPDERASVILAHVQGLAAAVLGTSRSEMLDIHQGLFEMGMDSLMSVELKTRLEKSVGKGLPSTLTFNYPTIAELAEYIGTSVLPAEAAAPPAPAAAPVVASVPEDVDDLSEDDLADLLMKKLKGLQ